MLSYGKLELVPCHVINTHDLGEMKSFSVKISLNRILMSGIVARSYSQDSLTIRRVKQTWSILFLRYV